MVINSGTVYNYTRYAHYGKLILTWSTEFCIPAMQSKCRSHIPTGMAASIIPESSAEIKGGGRRGKAKPLSFNHVQFLSTMFDFFNLGVLLRCASRTKKQLASG